MSKSKYAVDDDDSSYSELTDSEEDDVEELDLLGSDDGSFEVAESDDDGDAPAETQRGSPKKKNSTSKVAQSKAKAAKAKKKEEKEKKKLFNKLVEGESSTPHVPPSATIIKSVRPPVKNPRLIKGYKETAYERTMRDQAIKKLKHNSVYHSNDELGLTEDQKRLLYMISLYSYAAKSEEERERCIRRSALMVLVFEGIVSHTFDYDYAPASVVVGNPPRRVFLNFSQEAKDDIDDLMEVSLIKGVRLSSKFGSTDVAYQLAPRGVSVIADFAKSTIMACNAVCHDPKDRDYLLDVEWREKEGMFYLTSGAGYERRSSVTDAEDVSYVSSAYIPNSLRTNRDQPHSYEDQAEDAAAGCTSIKDELSELMHLENVHMLMSEWIPFGSNQMAGLNARLGSEEKVQGGSFTAQIDDGKCATQCAVDAGLTSVRVLDYSQARHVNCEASIEYPESAGITQIENFGLSVHASGRIIAGLRIESIMDRVKDEMAIDLLARLMVDIQMDSSSLLDSLLSPYQRSVLDVVYRGHVMQRPKFTVIMADGINPKMLARKYMDGEDHENELRQVLGATNDAYDLEDDFLLVVGETGILMVGADVKAQEDLAVAFLTLQSMNMFIGGLFDRLFELNDNLTEVHRILDVFERDPAMSSSQQVQKIRNGLSGSSHVAIRLHEALLCMENGLKRLKIPKSEDCGSNASQRLHKILKIETLHEDVADRIADLERNVDGAQRNLSALREMSVIVRDSLLARLNDQIQLTTNSVGKVYASTEKTSSSSQIIQTILAGLLAYATIDHIIGHFSIVESADWAISLGLVNEIWFPIVVVAIALLLWLLFGYAWVHRTYLWSQVSNLGGITVQMRCNIPISIRALRFWLVDKNVVEETEVFDARGDIKTISWQETNANLNKWKGSPPHVSLTFDEKAGMLLSITLNAPAVYRTWRKGSDVMTPELLRQLLMQDLDGMGIIVH